MFRAQTTLINADGTNHPIAHRLSTKTVEHRQITIQLRHALYVQVGIVLVFLMAFSIGLTKTVDKLNPLMMKAAAASTVGTTTAGPQQGK